MARIVPVEVRGDSPDLVSSVRGLYETAGLIERIHELSAEMQTVAAHLVRIQLDRADTPRRNVRARRRLRVAADRHAERLLQVERERARVSRDLARRATR